MNSEDEGTAMWKHPVFLALFIGSSLVFAALCFGFLRLLAELPIWLSVLISLPTGVGVFMILLWLQAASDGPTR
jgi:vacuolar-type H+-ATPase subunit I/STV1